jgi:hypothetical protein
LSIGMPRKYLGRSGVLSDKFSSVRHRTAIMYAAKRADTAVYVILLFIAVQKYEKKGDQSSPFLMFDSVSMFMMFGLP